MKNTTSSNAKSLVKSTYKSQYELSNDAFWLYKTIYNALYRMETAVIPEDIHRLHLSLESKRADILSSGEMQYIDMYNSVMALANKSMDWYTITKLLYNDQIAGILKTDYDLHNCPETTIYTGVNSGEERYSFIQYLMVKHLTNFDLCDETNTTLGLFYPECYNVNRVMLPDEVKAFNTLFTKPANKISKSDWMQLLHLYIDDSLRQYHAIFLHRDDYRAIDICSMTGQSIEQRSECYCHKPILTHGQLSDSIVVRMLISLLQQEKKSSSELELQECYFEQINSVLEALWKDLTDPNYDILDTIQYKDSSNKSFNVNPDNNYGVNVKNLAFRFYSDVYLCNTNIKGIETPYVTLRPISHHFKNFSPYLIKGEVVKLNSKLHEVWKPIGGEELLSEGLDFNEAKVRPLLDDNGLWGEDGVFAYDLSRIYFDMPIIAEEF